MENPAPAPMVFVPTGCNVFYTVPLPKACTPWADRLKASPHSPSGEASGGQPLRNKISLPERRPILFVFQGAHASVT